MAKELVLLHLCSNLSSGGCCRDMENLARLGAGSVFRHILAGFRGDDDLVRSLATHGLEAAILGERLEGLQGVARSGGEFAALIHRSGSREAVWDFAVPALRAAGARVVLERNIFGYCDDGPVGRDLDLVCCNSLHTLWRHWTASGRPGIDEYLQKHRVLYCSVLLNPDGQELDAARGSVRKHLGITPEAFVVGSVSRPDPLRLDYMVPALLPRLKKEIRGLHFIARTYPPAMAKAAAESLGPRFHNLPPTDDESELLATYAACDVLAHFSSMGESFGMAIAEAMRCGLPVVTNETPDAEQCNAQVELVHDGESGFLVNDPLATVQRLVDLARSPELRRKLGEAGRRRFELPPLAPQCIMEQLEMELLRLTGGPANLVRQPSDETVASYLVGYRPRRTAPAAAHGPAEAVWNAVAEARRLAWRVRRKTL